MSEASQPRHWLRENRMPLNYVKTAMLLALLTGILLFMGSVAGGKTGLVIAFVVAMVMNGVSLWKSDELVRRMSGAVEVDRSAAPVYHDMVTELSRRAGLPTPRIFVMESPQPNAFATGRNPAHGAVCVSTGLFDLLTKEEMAGVISHELSHIKNRDTLTMAVAATIGGAISMLAQWLQLSVLFGGGRDNRNGGSRLGAFAAMLLAPFAAMLVQMAISRSREYVADRLGGAICGNPLWLASALAKINTAVRGIPNPYAERAPATASLYIINPLTAGGMDNLFATHPDTGNRIAALEAQAAEMGIRGFDDSGGAMAAARPAPQHIGRAGPGAGRGPWG